jgi:hypothetical protein
MRRFEYFEPATLDEAVALMQRFGGDASLLAGGTDLLVEIREHIRWPRQVVNIKKIPGMAALAYDDRTGLRFGALVTAREIEISRVVLEKYPGLVQARASSVDPGAPPRDDRGQRLSRLAVGRHAAAADRGRRVRDDVRAGRQAHGRAGGLLHRPRQDGARDG